MLLAGLGPLLILGLIVGIAFLAGRLRRCTRSSRSWDWRLVLTIWFSTMLSLVTPVVVLRTRAPAGPWPGPGGW